MGNGISKSAKDKREAYRKKESYWGNIITTWYFSGLSSGKFCKKHELDVCDFRKWLCKLRLARPVIVKDEEPKQCSQTEHVEPITFIPVQIADIRKELKINGSEIDILLPNGVRLRLGKNFDEALLVRAITTLKLESC